MAIEWAGVLQSIGGPAIVGGAFLLYLKHLLTQERMDRQCETDRSLKQFELESKRIADYDLKRFEVEIRTKADRTIEELKASLETAAVEHQIRFSNLHEKKAAAIAKLYRLLVESAQAGSGLLIGLEDEDQPLEADWFAKVLHKIDEARAFFESHRIYFDDCACAAVEKCLVSVGEPLLQLEQFRGAAETVGSTTQERNRAVAKALRIFEGDVPPAKRALEKAFRRTLDPCEIRGSRSAEVGSA